MSTFVVGIYGSIATAQRAVNALVESGFEWGSVSVVLRMAMLDDDGISADAEGGESVVALDDVGGRMVVSAAGFVAAGPLALALQRTGLRDRENALPALLSSAGIRASVAGYLRDALSQGAILVAVHCEEGRISDAHCVLRDQAPIPYVDRPAWRGQQACDDGIEASLPAPWPVGYGKMRLQ